MIVKLEVLDNDFNPKDRGREGDKVIRAVDGAMHGASWEATGNGWTARR